MTSATFWVAFFVLLGLFAAALVAKLVVRVVRGPQQKRDAERRLEKLRNG